MRNALQLNLVPVGNIPRDGNCMFHSVALSLNELDGTSLTQQDIRNQVANWLRNHPVTSNGVNLSDFIYNQSWDQYIEGVLNNEWGDNICLLAITQIFKISVKFHKH